jgi:hypothetical protein
MAVALGFHIGLGLEAMGGAVHAVSEATGSYGGVGENVNKIGAALLGPDLGSNEAPRNDPGVWL